MEKSGKSFNRKKKDDELNKSYDKKERTDNSIKIDEISDCNNFPFISNFDKMREYELYFPEQNFTKVILKYNNSRRKNRGYKLMISRKKI